MQLKTTFSLVSLFAHIIVVTSQDRCQQLNGVKVRSKCFFIVKSEGIVTFTRAIQVCEAHGSTLASVHSREDVSAVKQLAKGEHYIWLGARPMVWGSRLYQWLDGSPFDFAPWGQNEPNEYNSTCSGLSLHRYDGFFDDHCWHTRVPVCQIETRPRLPEAGETPTAVSVITAEQASALKKIEYLRKKAGQVNQSRGSTVDFGAVTTLKEDISRQQLDIQSLQLVLDAASLRALIAKDNITDVQKRLTAIEQRQGDAELEWQRKGENLSVIIANLRKESFELSSRLRAMQIRAEYVEKSRSEEALKDQWRQEELREIKARHDEDSRMLHLITAGIVLLLTLTVIIFGLLFVFHVRVLKRSGSYSPPVVRYQHLQKTPSS